MDGWTRKSIAFFLKQYLIPYFFYKKVKTWSEIAETPILFFMCSFVYHAQKYIYETP